VKNPGISKEEERMPQIDMERRICIRFEIPGATLSYKTKKFFSQKGAYQEEFCPVADISRGGLRFLSRSQPKLNTSLLVKIAIPGEQIPLLLKGVIRWIGRHAGSIYSTQIGVQFNPYGDENKEQNYPGALVKIIALEQKFAPDDTLSYDSDPSKR